MSKKVNIKDLVDNAVEIINRTGHVMRDLDSGFEVDPAKDDDILRVQKSSLLQGKVMDCNIFVPVEEVYGNIPDYDPKKIYIVSKRVADVLARDPKYKDRYDFIYPVNIEHEQVQKPIVDAYNKVVTDSKGNPVTIKQCKIKGCRGFEIARRPE